MTDNIEAKLKICELQGVNNLFDVLLSPFGKQIFFEDKEEGGPGVKERKVQKNIG